MKTASISIIEDYKVVRDNVMHFVGLHEEFTIGKVAGSVDAYLKELKLDPAFKSDVLLLDIGLPGISGLEAIPILLENDPDLNIIMLTSYEEEDIILKAICSGACAYISKKTPLQDIVNGIRVVVAGGSYMSPTIAKEIVNHLMGGRVSKATILSNRQKEILECMVDGKSYADISAELFISIETVRSHIKKMYRILHVNNKTDAIAMYLKGQIK